MMTNQEAEWFRWICKFKKTKLLLVSKIYDNFDECYLDYCQQMEGLANDGVDLSEVDYRGVFDYDNARCEMLNHH